MIIILTLLSLLAFAANSVLCRIALGHEYIDPTSFTIIRLLSGSIALYVIFTVHKYYRKSAKNKYNSLPETAKGSWLGSVFLFIYALSFSYAYGYLDTGTGALILFGSVQISMILYAVISQHRLLKIEWLGLSIACAGFIYLIYPDLTTPSLLGFILMMLSGIAWAGYTLIGKQSKYPLIDTCYNFFRTIPYVFILALLTLSTAEYSYNGIMLAITSGVVMSAIGYAIWYRALSGLTTTKAAVLQLLVPVIATIGGVIFMDEVMTLRLQLATVIVLGGIALVIQGKKSATFTNKSSCNIEK